MSCSNSRWYVKISTAAKADIEWWATALNLFVGQAAFPCDVPLPAHCFTTDASGTGCSGHYRRDWYYVNWEADCPAVGSKHMTYQELYAVLCAARRWGKLWQGQHILVRSDNLATVASINKSTSRSPEMMSLIRELFWLSVSHDFRLTARFIPGKLNVLADRISRLVEPKAALDAWNLLNYLTPFNCFMCYHLSFDAFCMLQRYWGRLL